MYPSRLFVLDVDGLRGKKFQLAYGSRYSIHSEATMTYIIYGKSCKNPKNGYAK